MEMDGEKVDKELFFETLKKCSDFQDEINEDMDLFSDLGMNSLGFIELIALLEDNIGDDFNDLDDVYDQISNIGFLYDYLQKKQLT